MVLRHTAPLYLLMIVMAGLLIWSLWINLQDHARDLAEMQRQLLEPDARWSRTIQSEVQQSELEERTRLEALFQCLEERAKERVEATPETTKEERPELAPCLPELALPKRRRKK